MFYIKLEIGKKRTNTMFSMEVQMDEFKRKAVEEEHMRMHQLYVDDPEEFERQARARIDQLINESDPAIKRHLRWKQLEIDTKLARHKDPISRYNKMIELLFKGVDELANALQGKHTADKKGSMAKVLQFVHKKK